MTLEGACKKNRTIDICKLSHSNKIKQLDPKLVIECYLVKIVLDK